MIAALGSETLPDRARALGVGALSDDQLIAVLVGPATNPERALDRARDLLSAGLLSLAARDVESLIMDGQTPVHAAQVGAAFELARRVARAQRRTRPSCRTPEEVVALVAPDLVPLAHEQLLCLALDPHQRLIAQPRLVSTGDVDGCDAGPRAFFRNALAVGATNALAVHNHPSGCAQASAADIAVTRRLAAAGRIVDIMLVDHIVISDGLNFTSIRRSHPEAFC